MGNNKCTDLPVTAEDIKASPLGGELSDAQCLMLAEVATACAIKDREYLIEEGHRDDALHVLTRGHMEVVARTGKGDPVVYAENFKPRPWTIEVSGHAEKTGTFDFEDFMKPFDLEERIYRMRCVEAWSMVIPWVGISLADVVKHFQPTSTAQYVAFETLNDREQMPGVRGRSLDWPYREGLTIAEATNPLPILAVGVYGNVIPNQNGAPIRLVVPWKYGFKGVKSIVKIRFMSTRPKTSWNMSIPREYGFYANVNPEVSHPRWSQARERRIGGSIFAQKQDTLMFNGYGEHVAHLYKDLDLRRNF